MTPTQIRSVIYCAFYRVVRIGQEPNIATFFNSTIDDTWPKTPSPGGWEDFWWEAVAVEMQSGFMARKWFLDDLDAPWLKEHKSAKWQEIADYAGENLSSLT